MSAWFGEGHNLCQWSVYARSRVLLDWDAQSRVLLGWDCTVLLACTRISIGTHRKYIYNCVEVHGVAIAKKRQIKINKAVNKTLCKKELVEVATPLS